MNAMILAAGLGTRLHPWTLHHPKALVKVDGAPMLHHVITRLINEGAEDIVINVHHFAQQIIDYIATTNYGIPIKISDESLHLLDTGGGLRKALQLFSNNKPVLIHNADILSTVPLCEMYNAHLASSAHITLAVSKRQSSRKLYFNEKGFLRGWSNPATGATRPEGFIPNPSLQEMAFSGIYIIGDFAKKALEQYARPDEAFPIMNFFLSHVDSLLISQYNVPYMKVLDIGKPEALQKAPDFMQMMRQNDNQ